MSDRTNELHTARAEAMALGGRAMPYWKSRELVDGVILTTLREVRRRCLALSDAVDKDTQYVLNEMMNEAGADCLCGTTFKGERPTCDAHRYDLEPDLR